jgi:hypothetical protein
MAKKQNIASEIGSAIGAAAARAEQLISSKPATKTTKPTAKRTTAAKHSANSTKKTAKAEPVVDFEEAEIEGAEINEAIAEVETPQLTAVAIEIDREEIAKQAYLYWEARGFLGGNPAEDWVRAEEELKQRAGKTMSASV